MVTKSIQDQALKKHIKDGGDSIHDSDELDAGASEISGIPTPTMEKHL